MNKINLSIIIPHYNIPELLERCLRSIPKRDDIQIIVVDDGSPGGDEYISRLPELTAAGVEFYHIPHLGRAGMVRNIGLEYAKGDRITFIDADDFFEEDANRLFDIALSIDKDLIVFQARAVLSDDITTPSSRLNKYREYYERKDELFFRYLHNMVWCKIIKRSLILENNIIFSDHTNSDDTLFATKVGIFAHDVEIRKEMLVVVTDREGSLTYRMRNKMPSASDVKAFFTVDYLKCRLLMKHNVRIDPGLKCLLRDRVRATKSLDKSYYIIALIKAGLISPKIPLQLIKADIRQIFKGL